MPGEPERLVPPGCSWSPVDGVPSRLSTFSIVVSVDIHPEEFYGTAPPTGTRTVGGYEWSRRPNPFGEQFCDFATQARGTRFVGIGTSVLGEPEQACAVAEQALPLVSAHLAGR
ncbi:hypothetical protein SAMN05421810_105400 [Amycolatopsis arida]|uniref:Uncharacterized protein n=2 Tax=Amycolatopsis arida TaxID=587909 RepID=A0A1I5X2N9_9PSEU|nr:hypothetical protein CLV69_105419 [Amycolatopsis arida]SFQ26208.1 hypothetical protein SAMN05421810_105400 [Amycolatopsis arida]